MDSSRRFSGLVEQHELTLSAFLTPVTVCQALVKIIGKSEGQLDPEQQRSGAKYRAKVCGAGCKAAFVRDE